MEFSLETPFGSLTCNLFPAHVAISGFPKINGIAYNARIEFHWQENEWKHRAPSDLYLRRKDQKDTISFPARDKFITTVLALWKQHVTPELLEKAKQIARTRQIEDLEEEISELEHQLTEKRISLRIMMERNHDTQ